MWALLLAVSLWRGADAFSNYAGACEHAGVQHGLDYFEPQPGAGGHGVYVEGAGRGIAQAALHGASVQVVLHGAAPYKGLNLFAVDANDVPIGSWPAAQQPADVQVEHKITPHLRDELQWLPPSTLRDGDKVTFKATVVAEYATWWAFTQSFTVGQDDPSQPRPAEEGSGGTPEIKFGSSAETGGDGGGRHAPGQAPGSLGRRDVAPVVPVAIDADAAVKPAPTVRWWPKWVSARLHALLMTVSFLGLAPSAILTARHGKKDARWFNVHANLQYAAAGCTLLALALALYDLAPLDAPYWHGTVGLAAATLMIANPINAWLRPDKSRRRVRALWFKFHVWGGRLAVVLGAVNVFTGLMIATLHRWGGLWVWITATALLFTLAVVCTASLEMRRRAAYRRMRELKL